MRPFLMFALASALSALASPSVAQSARTFVATTGSDSNPCSAAAPCRTIQAAVNAVAVAGEVLILDSGGFGTNIQITKSVSILVQPGVLARVVSNGAAAMTINGSNIQVVIDGLGFTGNLTGITFVQGRSLVVRNIDVNTPDRGIAIVAPDAHTIIADSQFRNATECVQAAMPSGMQTRVSVVGTRTFDCFIGMTAGMGVTMDVSNSAALGRKASCSAGFLAEQQGAFMTVESSVSTHCTYGVLVQVSAVLSVSNTLLASNSVAGSTATGGVGQTSGNNRALVNSDNSLNGFGAVVPLK